MLLRGFTLKITGVIVRSRTTQLLYIGVRKLPLSYGSRTIKTNMAALKSKSTIPCIPRVLSP